ncbi:unnamed protein product [Phytomonas sp. EM1]|nr:unnamed protein product [Phytomonas sp. EM1]|eukprot:CCW60305.1 unnamed protein product [Phytomonas sp. isolate EM1]
MTKQNSSVTSQEFNKTAYLIKNKSRVTLPGVTPGMVLQASLSSYHSIVNEARLPDARYCSVLNFKPQDRRLRLRSSPFQPLPCMSAARRSCEHCPWMVSSAFNSAELKSEALRRVLHTVAEAASSSRQHQTTRTAYNAPMVHFLEPLSVPVKPHSLQELELVYSPSNDGGGGALVEEKENRGFSFVATTCEGYSTVRGCFLLTLEEKRLIFSLNRWAAQLPAVMRGSLKMAYVAQLSSETSVRGDPGVGLQELRWQSTLSLVVLLNRDVHNWGPQSPLCGPNHPPDLLSHEEQALVDAVLAAAPLQKDIHVLVCLDENELEVLYPVVNRGVRWEDIANCAQGSPPGIPVRPALRCICGSMEAPVHVPFPGLHNHLCYNLHRRYLHRSMPKDESAKDLLCAARPVFWRHSEALSTACSAVATLLLGSDTVSASPFIVGLFPREIPQTADASAASSGAGKHKPASLADSRAATMLFTAALSATIREFTTRFDQKDCVGVLNLGEILKDQGEGATKLFHAASFFMMATVADAHADSREVCELIHAWQDQLLRVNIYPTQIARLMLLQCSTNMKLEALKVVVEKILEDFGGHGNKTAMRLHVDRLQAGVIDVDILSASFVGYTLIELSWR